MRKNHYINNAIFGPIKDEHQPIVRSRTNEDGGFILRSDHRVYEKIMVLLRTFAVSNETTGNTPLVALYRSQFHKAIWVNSTLHAKTCRYLCM